MPTVDIRPEAIGSDSGFDQTGTNLLQRINDNDTNTFISSPLEIWTKHNLSLLGFNPIVSLSNAIILEALKLAGRSPL